MSLSVLTARTPRPTPKLTALAADPAAAAAAAADTLGDERSSLKDARRFRPALLRFAEATKIDRVRWRTALRAGVLLALPPPMLRRPALRGVLHVGGMAAA